MTKNQQLKEKIAEIIIKHLGVCDKKSPEEILRLFKEEVLQILKEIEEVCDKLINEDIRPIIDKINQVRNQLKTKLKS